MFELPAVIAAVLALGLATAVAWVMRPSVPDLDEERWFKLIFATLLRGQVESSGGDAAAWEAAVRRFVPYHPAGRYPEEKVFQPHLWSPSGPAMPGELALVEALGRLSGPRARWRHLYEVDEIGLESRYSDPQRLGEAYLPERWLGPGLSWEALAAWGSGNSQVEQTLFRAPWPRWLLVGGTGIGPPLLDALAVVLGARASRSSPAELPAALDGLTQMQGCRVIIVGEGEGIAAVMGALAEDAGARDALAAVLSLGGVIRGWPGREGFLGEMERSDWLGAHFTQEGMDLEARRRVPWLSAAWFDPEADTEAALPIANQRFPIPKDEVGGRIWVDTIDLGVLPLRDDLPLDLLARAVVVATLAIAKTRSG